MRVLAIGDLIGSAGIKKLKKELPKIIESKNIDFVIVNGENSAEGMGMTERNFKDITEEKVNVITMGNHTWGKRDIFKFIDNPKIIRPANYPKGVPGKGYNIYTCKDKKIAVINLIGRVDINVLSENPFLKAKSIIEKIENEVDMIFIDFHAEATAEKIALGYFLDGKATAIYGTHTHVQTADERIIENAEKVFEYILFFDNVRKVDNFKTINSIKEVVKNLTILRNEKFKIKTKDDFEDKLYKQIVDDMLAKEIYLEKFEDDKFYLEMQNAKENIYYVTLLNNIKVSENYSERAKDKAFSSKIVAEDKIKIEYILLSIISLKDILSGNFDDVYISRFECSLFKKEKKLESTLNLIDNEALKEKINLNITYEEYVTYNKKINELIGQGYKFCITLDNTFNDIEKLENLKIFNIVILPKEIRQYNEISRKKKIYKNIIEK